MKLCLRAAFVLAFFAPAFASAQVEPSLTTLSGKVTDAATGLPIPFASIQLQSGKTGTATNDHGEFIFKIPASTESDTIAVSSVGYNTVWLPLKGAGGLVNIALVPSVVELAPVTINAASGLNILKEAIARIPDNCDTSAVRMTAFYTENIWLDTMELSFNETVLDIFKTFYYDKHHNDGIRIIKGRKKNIHFKQDGQLLYWISGISNGARGSLGDDMIKYHAYSGSPFNPRNFRYYTHDYAGTILENGRETIILDIAPRNNSPRGLFNMKVYIDEESYAIIGFDLECTEAGVRRVSRKDKGVAYAIMTKVVGATLDYHHFQVRVRYKKFGDKWYLNTVARHFEILVNSKKRRMVDSPWRADMQFIVTDIDTAEVKAFQQGDIGNNTSTLSSIIGDDPDPDFWENYNILKPVLADSIANKFDSEITTPARITAHQASNRQNGFTRADTLRGKLTSLRTCYDVTFYHLDVKVDLEDRSVAGSNLIRFHVMEPFSRMQIDLFKNMAIDKIIFRGDSLPFSREYNAVYVDFPQSLPKDLEDEIRIFYRGKPKTPDFNIPMDGGVLWDKDSLGNHWAQVVCQGSGASLWWPNKDHQSDEPDSMKIWITVPAGYTEVSNGRLIRKTAMPDDQTRYEWFVSYPINNYNVTFNIGKYASYRELYITDDTLTIDYHVMSYNLERSKRIFEHVKPMLRVFERSFGKYPFGRDGFALVESLYPMEHQSGVCIGRITRENATNTNPLVWHESAHEWWGNSVTCKDIADMWIHEAFATYAEMFVVEELVGKETASQFMLDQVGSVMNREPIQGVYDVNHIFYDIGDMYSKGSLMLHTFRNMLDNDSVWFGLLKNIQDEFRYQTISSDQLVRFINHYTGTDYTYFFAQYLEFTDLPELQLEVKESGNDLIVQHRWVADVKGFRMPVRVYTGEPEPRFIRPTEVWQSTLFRNVKASDFYVDEERFFIKVSSGE